MVFAFSVNPISLVQVVKNVFQDALVRIVAFGAQRDVIPESVILLMGRAIVCLDLEAQNVMLVKLVNMDQNVTLIVRLAAGMDIVTQLAEVVFVSQGL
mgnify:CR=1 FL=1